MASNDYTIVDTVNRIFLHKTSKLLGHRFHAICIIMAMKSPIRHQPNTTFWSYCFSYYHKPWESLQYKAIIYKMQDIHSELPTINLHRHCTIS